ncbi:glycosyltransferase family 25 protein [Pseudotabrizicola sediminis]|uniref:Glycosyltransferase family 25 protein n=1 Tax=Pseudotabrizicola sediminis TaxID=2486418 RepID=A0ABY2KGR5_9RHOB|nr:glycosyltransferase family 25 protein [Pseudotabrizicola sediminis]TGD41404.1 glycosyltransferase family 25 protein [Pseudotabrizicola sediminis]
MKNWPIFILSLPGEEVRRAPLLQALADMGMSYEVISGIDGRKGIPDCWSSEIDRASASRNFGRDLTDGEFACALSHREIYRQIATRGLPGAIVLEDDAIVGPQFAAFVKQKLYKSATLVMLDHSHARVAGPSFDLMPGVRMQYLTLPSCLTTAYSISTDAAQTLLKAASPVYCPADWPGDIVSLRAVALSPRIVDHPDPLTGSSHLNAARSKMPMNTGSLQRTIRRLTSLSHWQRWLTKRRSTRIS